MNWVQDQCMMLSSQAPPTGVSGGVSSAGGPLQPAMHRLPPTSPASPASSAQIAYEGRVSLVSPGGGQHWAHPPHFQPFNFNLLHSSFKAKDGEEFDQDRETSPSSSAGSPRTDETMDKSSDKLDRAHDAMEKSFEQKAEQDGGDRQKSSLEILQEHLRHIPAVSASPERAESSSPPAVEEAGPAPPSLSIRQDIQECRGGGEADLRNISEEKEEDFEEEEELRIDEEMEEDRGRGQGLNRGVRFVEVFWGGQTNQDIIAR